MLTPIPNHRPGFIPTLRRALGLTALASSLSLAAIPLIIYDSDYGPDVDDVGALAVLHALADRGECKILAVGNVTANEWGPAAMDAVNTFYQRPNIPVGTWKHTGDYWSSSQFTFQIANEFPQNLGKKDVVPNVVQVYRKALAEAPDASVKFVVVGFLDNLEDLLKSPGDGISPLTGKELVAKKVIELSDMGGKYPNGGEFNFEGNGSSTKYTFENWPTPVVFSGFEIGSNIKTGGVLKARQQAKADPVARGYELYVGLGSSRESWDLTSALYAVRGADPYFTLSAEGCVVVQSNGSNTWDASKNCKHRYMIKKMDFTQVGRVLDSLLMLPVVPQKDKPDFQTVALAGGADAISHLDGSLVFAEGLRMVSVRSSGAHSIRITGIDGKTVLTRKGYGPKEYTLSTEFRTGIYLVTLVTEQGTTSHNWVMH